MPTFTGTTDANGTLVVPLESTQMGGEIIKIKASKGMSIMEKEITMPIPTYDPPPQTGGSNSGSGGSDAKTAELPSKKVAVTFDFPMVRDFALNVVSDYEEYGEIRTDPLRFNRDGATVRYENGVFLVKPSLPADLPDGDDYKLFGAVRISLDDFFAFPNDGRIITVASGYFDMAGYPTSDDYFEGGDYDLNYNPTVLAHAAYNCVNAIMDTKYIYVPFNLFFSIEGGVFNYSYYSYTDGRIIYQKREFLYLVLGEMFKVRLDL